MGCGPRTFAPMEPLVTCRERDANDRERLAEASHRKRCAKHKGRNHWRNWERRRMAQLKAERMAPVIERAKAAHGRYRDAVRAFWSGERETHP